MKITENRGNDYLEEYLNPQTIEKAPVGFTDKIMSSIRVEPVPLFRKSHVSLERIVPLAVIVTMAVLIIIAAIIPAGPESTLAGVASKLFQNVRLPSFKTETLPGLTLPAVVIYISVGLSVLLLGDLTIGRLLHRNRHDKLIN